MAQAVMLMIHILAFFFFWPALLVTIPLHLLLVK